MSLVCHSHIELSLDSILKKKKKQREEVEETLRCVSIIDKSIWVMNNDVPNWIEGSSFIQSINKHELDKYLVGASYVLCLLHMVCRDDGCGHSPWPHRAHIGESMMYWVLVDSGHMTMIKASSSHLAPSLPGGARGETDRWLNLWFHCSVTRAGKRVSKSLRKGANWA